MHSATGLRSFTRWPILFNDITDRVRAQQEADEEARRKDDFLALLAHGLRNPLAPIRYAVQALSVGRTNSRDALPELLPLIERQVAHMARLLDDLLDVSRISRGAIELRKERTDLRAAVRIGVEANHPLMERLHAELSVELPGDPLLLDGDPARLVQIVSNLLNNAANHSPAGNCIDLRAEQDGEWIILRVRDTGNGISPDDLPRIFGLFVQGGNDNARQQGGLGIGLSLVNALVELHGGAITAHSQGLGHGSEFVVRLPAVEREKLLT